MTRDKRPQLSVKNKTDLMPNNASCKRWDTLVTIAPAWFDPAEMPAQITPFIIGYTLHDALVLKSDG